ncbi:MAG: hypothetical protein J6B72_03415, partial [Clostridia bacterium]|nr:hypothetical protein [Clostridia bacterium]
GGEDIKIMGWNDSEASRDFNVDTASGDQITYQTYARNTAVEMRLHVKNNSTDTRQISIVGFCGSGFDEEYTRQGYNMAVADIDDSLGAIVTSRYAEFEKVGKRLIYSFMALSENTDAYDCTYNSVIGPYGSFAHSVPAAVVDHRDDVAMQEILIGVGAGLSKRDLT